MNRKLIIGIILISCIACSGNQKVISKIKVKGVPLSRLYYKAVDEKKIEKEYILDMTLKSRSNLATIEDRISNLELLDKQDIIPDIRVTCIIKYSNFRTKKLFILRNGIIELNSKYYNYDYELVRMILANVPEEMKDDFEPWPLIE